MQNRVNIKDESRSAVASLRRDYCRETLDKKSLQADPIDQFDHWFQEAMNCELIIEPNAMTLSTAGGDLKVTSRTVLMRGYDKEGFRFFTNSQSTKGQQMAKNPNVALLFYWAPLERQVKIHGSISLLPRFVTEDYFFSRPRESQLGAWASDQSRPLANRQALEDRLQELAKRFLNEPIPLPEFWNGYIAKPDSIEFWQGRPNRLHDRLRYQQQENGEWKIERLSP